MAEEYKILNYSISKDKIKACIKETVETVVVVFVLVVLIRSLIGEPRWIPSSSMEPTFYPGDNLIVEKISYRFNEPKRGDVVVFYPPEHELFPDHKLDPSLWGKFTRMIGFLSSDEAYIKRIIGEPGDTIKIVPDEGVYINGKLLDEPYKKATYYGPCRNGMICGPYKIPKDNYFMMGDNRNNSTDSRFWGTLPRERMVGKAFFKFWPITRIGLVPTPEYETVKK